MRFVLFRIGGVGVFVDQGLVTVALCKHFGLTCSNQAAIVCALLRLVGLNEQELEDRCEPNNRTHLPLCKLSQ